MSLFQRLFGRPDDGDADSDYELRLIREADAHAAHSNNARTPRRAFFSNDATCRTRSTSSAATSTPTSTAVTTTTAAATTAGTATTTEHQYRAPPRRHPVIHQPARGRSLSTACLSLVIVRRT